MKVKCLFADCGNEFEAKRKTAKFCSDNCRVKWNNRYGNKIKISKTQAQVLFNEMMEFMAKVKNGTPITDKPIYQYPLEEKDMIKQPVTVKITPQEIYKPTPKTFQQFMNEMADLEYEAEYKALAAEIEASELTAKQKQLLFTNMRTSKM